MRDKRLEVSVTFDERSGGYVASAPGLPTLTALSLRGLRYMVETHVACGRDGHPVPAGRERARGAARAPQRRCAGGVAAVGINPSILRVCAISPCGEIIAVDSQLP
jgi:hypothetical protein